jgi:uncharacterized damage-inducible protein DinB
MGANGKQPQPNNLPKSKGRSKVRKNLDTTDHKFEAYIPTSTTALLERFDKETAKAKEAFADFAPAKWDENWKFIAGGQAWIDESKYRVFRDWVLDHVIHHRAQLGVYLRLLDKPIPGTYGPSADEMPG